MTPYACVTQSDGHERTYRPILTHHKQRAESEAMKTKESRFHIHDELTAPEGSLPILKGALSTGGQLSNFLGVLAGSPSVLRAYARFRRELCPDVPDERRGLRLRRGRRRRDRRDGAATRYHAGAGRSFLFG